MDYGPFLSYTVATRPGLTQAADHLAVKGIVVKVDGTNAAVCFDTDTLRMAGGWTGGFLDVSRTHLDSYKGNDAAMPAGPLEFQTPSGPGWSGPDGVWADPRTVRNGPLPKGWAHYQGLYRHGEKVVFAYRVGQREVLELPGYDRGERAFTRVFRVRQGEETLRVRLLSAPSSRRVVTQKAEAVAWNEGEIWRAVFLQDPAAGLALRWDAENILFLEMDGKNPALAKVILWRGSAEPDLAALARRLKPLEDPASFIQGGPPLWPERLATEGRRGSEGGAYEVDTLTVPDRNPWNSWIRFVAHDFFDDGRAALSTWNGDVWIVSGIDEGLKRLVWSRHAAGLFDALGLKIVQGKVCVLGRDRITRLHDLNGDGEADFYENFNHDAPVTPSYHAFAMDLWTDREGNFLYTRCGQRADPALPFGGALLRISSDGSKLEQLASGLRAANGISIGPEGQITCADNQGNWIPSGRLNWIKEGAFYGFVPALGTGAPRVEPEKPLCWIPQTLDNSGGSQVWVTSDRWGSLKGQLLHLSYGKARLFLVPFETVNGVRQGGVTPFPLRFESGVMRAHFHPIDGQLYLSGLKGWQTDGARDAAFHRVRYTGKPLRLPVAARVKRGALELEFSLPLDRSSAIDAGRYAVERWNYRATAEYGSKDYSPSNANAVGRDKVEVRRAVLSADGRTVRLELESMMPVMQLRVQFDALFADGAALRSEYCGTVHAVPE